jgi:hypothetical protein
MSEDEQMALALSLSLADSQGVGAPPQPPAATPASDANALFDLS